MEELVRGFDLGGFLFLFDKSIARGALSLGPHWTGDEGYCSGALVYHHPPPYSCQCGKPKACSPCPRIRVAEGSVSSLLLNLLSTLVTWRQIQRLRVTACSSGRLLSNKGSAVVGSGTLIGATDEVGGGEVRKRAFRV